MNFDRRQGAGKLRLTPAHLMRRHWWAVPPPANRNKESSVGEAMVSHARVPASILAWRFSFPLGAAKMNFGGPKFIFASRSAAGKRRAPKMKLVTRKPFVAGLSWHELAQAACEVPAGVQTQRRRFSGAQFGRREEEPTALAKL